MGPLIFNLYVADLQSHMDNVKCHQYVDDTSLYKHYKPVDLQATVTELYAGVGKLETYMVMGSKFSYKPREDKGDLFTSRRT